MVASLPYTGHISYNSRSIPIKALRGTPVENLKDDDTGIDIFTNSGDLVLRSSKNDVNIRAEGGSNSIVLSSDNDIVFKNLTNDNSYYMKLTTRGEVIGGLTRRNLWSLDFNNSLSSSGITTLQSNTVLRTVVKNLNYKITLPTDHSPGDVNYIVIDGIRQGTEYGYGSNFISIYSSEDYFNKNSYYCNEKDSGDEVTYFTEDINLITMSQTLNPGSIIMFLWTGKNWIAEVKIKNSSNTIFVDGFFTTGDINKTYGSLNLNNDITYALTNLKS